VFLPPLAHSLIANPETTPNLAVVEILLKQLDGVEPALFQCHKIAFDARE